MLQAKSTVAQINEELQVSWTSIHKDGQYRARLWNIPHPPRVTRTAAFSENLCDH